MSPEPSLPFFCLGLKAATLLLFMGECVYCTENRCKFNHMSVLALTRWATARASPVVCGPRLRFSIQRLKERREKFVSLRGHVLGYALLSLEALRPFLASVENRDDFEAVASQPVRNDVRCARHDQLARTSNSAWPTKAGEIC